MENQIVANEWAVFLASPGVVELRWLPSTMTDAAFMATLCLLAWTAETKRPRGLLIDAREFRHRWGDGVMPWRDAHIVPRYGAAGVRKLAFLMPAGFPDAGKELVDGPAVFPTKWFVDRGEALAWLGS